MSAAPVCGRAVSGEWWLGLTYLPLKERRKVKVMGLNNQSVRFWLLYSAVHLTSKVNLLCLYFFVFRVFDRQWCHLTTDRACFIRECQDRRSWQLLICGKLAVVVTDETGLVWQPYPVETTSCIIRLLFANFLALKMSHTYRSTM